VFVTSLADYLPDQLPAFVLASVLIELTPGPNMAWLAMAAATEGRAKGFAAVVGVALGLAAIGIAGAVGAAELVQSSALVYETLRWAGIAFLFYLAWDGWRDGGSETGADAHDGYGRFFRRGLVTNLLNPKAAIFYVAVLPAFIDPSGAVLGQTLVLTAVYVAVATGIHAGIVGAAGFLTPILTNERRERFARRALSLMLAAVAVWFAFSTAR
jgi:threonine/homoserine/homoserine lactone efflux protein